MQQSILNSQQFKYSCKSSISKVTPTLQLCHSSIHLLDRFDLLLIALIDLEPLLHDSLELEFAFMLEELQLLLSGSNVVLH